MSNYIANTSADDSNTLEPESDSIEEARDEYLAAKSVREIEKAQANYVEALAKKYDGFDVKITGIESVDQLENSILLMREWNPIFFSVDQVKVILGEPTQMSDNQMVYTFDGGRVAISWVFALRDNQVTSFSYQSG